MIKKMNILIFLLIFGMLLFRIDAQATKVEGSVSKYSVDYEKSIEKDTTSNCKVLISIPYSYSETIPKNPYKPVQTGDEAPIVEYTLLMGTSVVGMIGILCNTKKHKY